MLRASIARKGSGEGAISRMRVIEAAKAGDQQDAESAAARTHCRAYQPQDRYADTALPSITSGSWRSFRSAIRRGGKLAIGGQGYRIGVLAVLAQLRWPEVPMTRSHYSKKAGAGVD